MLTHKIKQVFLSDIIMGGLYLISLTFFVYFIGEHLGIFPVILLYSSQSAFSKVPFQVTEMESVIFLIIIIEMTWVFGWITWYSFRKYSIQW